MAAINEFIDTLNVSAFEHAVDSDGSVWSSYGVTTQPSFVFIDESGTRVTHVGALGVEGLESRLDELVAR